MEGTLCGMPYNMQSAYLYAQKNAHCWYHNTHKTAQVEWQEQQQQQKKNEIKTIRERKKK